MTVARDTGGPAFPEQIAVTPTGDTYSGAEGMTLRDYFAAKAMQGLLAAGSLYKPEQTKTCVAFSYVLADIMLAERAK